MNTKKFYMAIIIMVLLLTSQVSVYAANDTNVINLGTEYEYMDDGSYFEISTIQTSSNLLRTTKTYERTKTYKNGSGTPLWYVRVTATFNYNGSTSSCTNAYSSAGSYNTAIWKIASHNASHANNNAVAYATAKRYMSGIVVETQNQSVTIACDANGNLY